MPLPRGLVFAVLAYLSLWTQSPTPLTPETQFTPSSQIVHKMITQAGWVRDWSLVSFRYTGTLTPAKTENGGAGIVGEYSGINRVKVVTRNAGLDQIAVCDGSQAQFSDSAATAPVSIDALVEAAAIFPFLSRFIKASKPNFSFEDAGADTVNGQVTELILVRNLEGEQNVADGQRTVPDTKIWVDLQSLLPIRSETPRKADGTSVAFLIVRRDFSDYRVIDGIAVPFAVQESIDGSSLHTIQISDFQFTAIPDAEFTINR